jgi:hypothetical protein
LKAPAAHAPRRSLSSAVSCEFPRTVALAIWARLRTCMPVPLSLLMQCFAHLWSSTAAATAPAEEPAAPSKDVEAIKVGRVCLCEGAACVAAAVVIFIAIFIVIVADHSFRAVCFCFLPHDCAFKQLQMSRHLQTRRPRSSTPSRWRKCSSWRCSSRPASCPTSSRRPEGHTPLRLSCAGLGILAFSCALVVCECGASLCL